MIKTIIKTLLVILLFLILILIYLSLFGIKTDKFNSQIINNVLKNNIKINLNLNEVSYLLDPYNFTINIKTKNPQVLLEDKILEINDIKTNVSLKSLINDQFSIDDLQITTKEIKLNDAIGLARLFQNSPKLFILNKIIKDGFIVANIRLNFDETGKIKKNYQINGSVKKARFNILNRFKLQNLNFDFDISKNNYSLKQIEAEINNVEIISPQIEIKKKKQFIFS